MNLKRFGIITGLTLFCLLVFAFSSPEKRTKAITDASQPVSAPAVSEISEIYVFAKDNFGAIYGSEIKNLTAEYGKYFNITAYQCDCLVKAGEQTERVSAVPFTVDTLSPLTHDNKQITFTVTYGGVSKSVSIPITVTKILLNTTFNSLSVISKTPQKYIEGQSFDPDSIDVKVIYNQNYSDGSIEQIEKDLPPADDGDEGWLFDHRQLTPQDKTVAIGAYIDELPQYANVNVEVDSRKTINPTSEVESILSIDDDLRTVKDVKVKKKKGSFTIKWKRKTKKITNYEVQYGTKKSFSDAITQKTYDKSFYMSYATKKTYYVRIRGIYDSGNELCYGKWVVVKIKM